MNSLKEKLKKNIPIVGAFLGFNSPEVVEMLGYLDYDFVMFDNEHSNISSDEIRNLIRTADSVNLSSLARLDLDRLEILQFLDAGGSGIQIPMIYNSDDVEKAVGYCKYSSKRYNRGLSLSSRNAKYGYGLDLESYIEKENYRSLVSIQIENKEAVKNLDKILKVENLDIVFIGPSDLSQAYDLVGKADSSEMEALMDKIIKDTVEAGKTPGIFAGNPNDIKKWIDKGVKFIITSAPALMIKGIKEYKEAFNKSL